MTYKTLFIQDISARNTRTKHGGYSGDYDARFQIETERNVVLIFTISTFLHDFLTRYR